MGCSEKIIVIPSWKSAKLTPSCPGIRPNLLIRLFSYLFNIEYIDIKEQKAHISKLELTLLDSCEEEKDLKKTDDRWICNMGTLFGGGLSKRNEVLSQRRFFFGGS